jgi:6-phosphogluconolactonase/glucosamine-6-phosphate isomerase/deaminase
MIMDKIHRRVIGNNVWLSDAQADPNVQPPGHALNYQVMESEEAVGREMLSEIETAARSKAGDLTIILLGGRGAQAMHRLIGEHAKTNELDHLLSRLHVFTQDALAPMRMENNFSFVRDFERLLGADFFRKVKSFTAMRTDTKDLEGELIRYLEQLESRGEIDILFLGLGPEADAASHLAYIKPNSGSAVSDLAGVIPISPDILNHHIAKFKAGGARYARFQRADESQGTNFSDSDEAECRRATHILTLGPAAILRANRIVQSIVDADTAPAKRVSFKRLIETEISDDPETRQHQLDENPGLWIRLHPNVRSLILPNVLT